MSSHGIPLKSSKQANDNIREQLGDETTELENHFILRLPLDAARNVRQLLEDGEERFKDKLKINFNPDMRRAQVTVDHEIFNGTLLDLPCIIETLKTVDKKNFYKVTDCPQLLVCKREGEEDIDEIFKHKKHVVKKEKKVPVEGSTDQDDSTVKKKDKQYQFPHGITPPLKNVRKRRFRKTLKKKYMDAPELEKELKRLLRTDLEAVSVRWEIVTPEEEAAQKQRTGSINKADNATDSDTLGLRLGESCQESSDSRLVAGEKISTSIKEDDIFGEALSSTSSSSSPSSPTPPTSDDEDNVVEKTANLAQLSTAASTSQTVEPSVSMMIFHADNSNDGTLCDDNNMSQAFPPLFSTTAVESMDINFVDADFAQHQDVSKNDDV